MSRSARLCTCSFGQRQLDSFQAQDLGHLFRSSPTILSPIIFGRLFLPSQSPSRFLSSADSSLFISLDRRDSAPTPVLTADFLVSRPSSRRSESGFPTLDLDLVTDP